MQVEVDVTNTGTNSADEVVQLYIHRKVAPLAQPVRELRAFERVSIGAGAHKKVQLTLTLQDLAFYQGSQVKEHEDGEFDLWIGGSSDTNNAAEFSTTSGKFALHK